MEDQSIHDKIIEEGHNNLLALINCPLPHKFEPSSYEYDDRYRCTVCGGMVDKKVALEYNERIHRKHPARPSRHCAGCRPSQPITSNVVGAMTEAQRTKPQYGHSFVSCNNKCYNSVDGKCIILADRLVLERTFDGLLVCTSYVKDTIWQRLKTALIGRLTLAHF